jgi:hypothetical protein
MMQSLVIHLSLTLAANSNQLSHTSNMMPFFGCFMAQALHARRNILRYYLLYVFWCRLCQSLHFLWGCLQCSTAQHVSLWRCTLPALHPTNQQVAAIIGGQHY